METKVTIEWPPVIDDERYKHPDAGRLVRRVKELAMDELARANPSAWLEDLDLIVTVEIDGVDTTLVTRYNG